MEYNEIIERRRALRIRGYKTLADVGFEGPWVTPYQMTSCSPDGPVLVGLHWLDEESILENEVVLRERGYAPDIAFNKVLDIALRACGMSRSDIYMTQSFHLVPTKRSEDIPPGPLMTSFAEVTRHELDGRFVIALGDDAAGACAKAGIEHEFAYHPSRRRCSYEAKAAMIARGLNKFKTTRLDR